MKVLMIGDIFGSPGRQAITELVPKLRDQKNISFVIGNAENAAGGKGLTPETAYELLDAGVDVITLGNHFRDQPSIDHELENNPRILRPLNYSSEIPGKGQTIIQSGRHGVGVLNLMGMVHMPEIESPFLGLEDRVKMLRQETPLIFVDFHAEATSEKRAMGFFLDGKVSVMAGTHTHVQTADEQILPQGTAYISDLGMTGPHDSVIGLDKEVALYRFAKFERKNFEVATGDIRLCGMVIEVDTSTGKAISVERINEKLFK